MISSPLSGLSRIVLASNNPGKFKEFAALFAPLGIELVPQSEWNVPDAPEPHVTFIENALEKARHASRLTGLPALADDSGLCVDALQGAPGVQSARFAQAADGSRSDAANNAKLMACLSGVAERQAHYVAVLALVRHADDPQPLFGEGVWTGMIAEAPAGDNGFGYDPYFFIPEFGQTVAQLPAEQKNSISHRARALAQLLGKFPAA